MVRLHGQYECRVSYPSTQSPPFQRADLSCSCFQSDQKGRAYNPASDSNKAHPDTRLSSPERQDWEADFRGPQADLALACQSGFSAVLLVSEVRGT